MTSEITRIFHCNPPDEDVVVVRHSPLTDSYEITLNGVTVKTFEEPNFVRWFAVRKKRYVLRSVPTGGWLLARALGSYTYELEIDGKRCKENNETLGEERREVNTVDLRVLQYLMQGDGVVWYLVTWPEFNVCVHRRFRDFYSLYQQVASAYRGTHLLASVPEPPSKELMPNASSNKTSTFLESRMRQLEVFLKRLNGFPGIKGGFNPDVQEFLGIGSARLGVFETSIVFTEGKLGIKLKQPVAASPTEVPTFSAQIAGILTNPNDSQVAKLDRTRIRVGDMVTRVGGESALLVGYDKVVSLLQNPALRPVVVHLLGVRDDGGEEAIHGEGMEVVSKTNDDQPVSVPTNMKPGISVNDDNDNV